MQWRANLTGGRLSQQRKPDAKRARDQGETIQAGRGYASGGAITTNAIRGGIVQTAMAG